MIARRKFEAGVAARPGALPVDLAELCVARAVPCGAATSVVLFMNKILCRRFYAPPLRPSWPFTRGNTAARSKAAPDKARSPATFARSGRFSTNPVGESVDILYTMHL